jgi:hypothetical protein
MVKVIVAESKGLGAYFLEFFVFKIEFLGGFLEMNVCLDAVGFVGAYSLFEGGYVG